MPPYPTGGSSNHGGATIAMRRGRWFVHSGAVGIRCSRAIGVTSFRFTSERSGRPGAATQGASRHRSSLPVAAPAVTRALALELGLELGDPRLQLDHPSCPGEGEPLGDEAAHLRDQVDLVAAVAALPALGPGGGDHALL